MKTRKGYLGLLLALGFIIHHSTRTILFADPGTTTGLNVQTTGSNSLHGVYVVSGSGASLTATNGYVGSSGSAAVSGSAVQSGTAGYALTSGSAVVSGSATQSNTAGYALTSGSAVISGSAATVNPGIQFFDSSDDLEIDLGARSIVLPDGSVAIDLSESGQNYDAALSFGSNDTVYTKNNTLDSSGDMMVAGEFDVQGGVFWVNSYYGVSTYHSTLDDGYGDADIAGQLTTKSIASDYGSILSDGSGNLRVESITSDGWASYLADSSGNLYWSDGNILADSSGNLYSESGGILCDSGGNLYYSGGNKMADSSGNLWLNNAFVSDPGATFAGYVVIYDSTGTPYDVGVVNP